MASSPMQIFIYLLVAVSVPVSLACQWERNETDPVTFLSTYYPAAPACNNAIRLASYDDVFDNCVTSCKGKPMCKLVIAKQKPLGNSQSSCSEFTSICTSIGSPCRKCPKGIDYAAWCPDCREGFVRRRNHCYKYLPERVTRTKAVQNCLDIGAILAEPRTPDENTAVAKVGPGVSNMYWIGLTNNGGNNGPWTWDSDGQTAGWTNWLPGRPDNNNVNMYVTRGQWLDMDGAAVPTMCQARPPFASSSPGCPDGWTFLKSNGKCYNFYDTKTNYDTAKTKCSEAHPDAVLAMPSYDEINQILNWLLSQNAWIGVHQTGIFFKWSNDSALNFDRYKYKYFRGFDPTGLRDMCFYMGFEGHWNVSDCNEQNSYFCEVPSECPEGTYGANCEKCTCIAESTDSCNIVDGTCTCKPGFNGTNCESECPEGTYGANCAESCTCITENTDSCNNVDGTCTCKPGFNGSNCESESTECPSGFQEIGGSCIAIETVKKTFNEATAACQQLGGFLAEPRSVELSNALTKLKLQGKFWIGIEDNNKDRTFLWQTDKATLSYTNWGRGQPNNWRGGQHCVCLNHGDWWRWDDQKCNRRHQYLCQI